MKNSFLKFSDKKMIYKVPTAEIIHVESDGMSTVTYTSSGEEHKCCKNLGAIYKELDKAKTFFRVHTSFIVNLTKIKAYKKEKGGIIVMTNGFHIPVSKRRKSEFLKKYLQ